MRRKQLGGYTVGEMMTTMAVMSIVFAFAGPFVYQIHNTLHTVEQRAAEDRFVAEASTMLRRSVRPTTPTNWQVAANKAALGDRDCRVEAGGMHFGLGGGKLQPLSIPDGLQCVFTTESDNGQAPRLVLTIHQGATLRARIVACAE